MNRLLPRSVLILAYACLLTFLGCSGVGDSSVSGTNAGGASELDRPPFDPSVPRTPRPSKSLTLAPDWQPPAPTRSQPAKLKPRVTPSKHWGAPTRPLGPHPSDAEFRAVSLFTEPLRPVPGASTTAETDALVAALRDGARDDRGIEAIDQFLETYPTSRWAPALHVNLGRVSFSRGYFQDALAHWQAGWDLAKAGDDGASQDFANLALAELAQMNGRLGRMTEVDALVAEAQKRKVMGDARLKIGSASEGAWMMHHQPGVSFRCGPYALVSVAKEQKLEDAKRTAAFLEKTQSPITGFSIPEVHRMSGELGLKLQIAKRELGASVIVPSVVHWKLGHFAAVIREEKGAFLLKDPTFGDDIWIAAKALDKEASGYFLVPAGPLPSGWSRATAAETAHLYGKGNVQQTNDKTMRHKVGGSCQSGLQMATYQFSTLSASLHIEDTPVGYNAAYGPDVRIRVEYDQRKLRSPTGMEFTNFGPQFGSNWISWYQPSTLTWTTTCDSYHCESGWTGWPEDAWDVPRDFRRGEVFGETAGIWKTVFPDGRQHFYEHVVGSSRFLSRVVDPQGNEVTVEYDSEFPKRIHQIVDAAGYVTEFHYDYFGEPYLVTSIEDPFGRTATFAYAMTAGKLRLQSTEDVHSIVSAFAYNDVGEIISMTTPYGTTTFNLSGPYVDSAMFRWIEATDPLGQTERVEFNVGAGSGIPGELESPQPNASVIKFSPNYTNYRNSFYWDKLLMKLAPYDHQKARIYHWLHETDNMVTDILESEVRPLEGRIFFNYPGQPAGQPYNIGFYAFPSVVGRVVKDAAGNDQTQATKFEYTPQTNVKKVTDPAGRETVLDYDANGIDVLAVKQRTGASTLVTMASSTYGGGAPAHRPTTITDGAGRVTTFTYASTGQVLTITNAKSEVTTFAYETNPTHSAYGRLLSITGDVPGGNRSFTYDGYGRVLTTTDSDGYTLTYDYDALDRLRTVTLPDGTSEQFEYEDHSLVATKDREGRWTRHMYNPLMQRVVSQDPSLRTTQFQWCRCGELKRFVDGNGGITEWDRDVGGRVIKKTQPDGLFETYTYDLSGRLSTAVDALSRTVTYKYALDDRLLKKDYSDTATPDVTYAYDTYFPRVSSRVDGAGTTTFTYQPYGTSTNGAGQVSLVNGPLTNDTQKHTYDELGRLKKLQIVDDATQTTASYSEEYTFDARGRVTTVANNLGNTTYAFVGQTNRPSTATYANGMRAQYDYFGATSDYVLKQIKNLTSGGSPSVISQFDYTYRGDRSIDTWKEEQGSGAKTWRYGYDEARELTSAERRDASQVLLESLHYGYDKAGNRVQVGSGTTAPRNYEVNSVNELLSERDFGRTTFAGVVDEPAKVTVNGKAAKVLSTDGGAPFKFEGTVDLDAGVNTVVVEATDGEDNVSTKTYSVTTTGTSKKYEYDSNGNLRYEKQPNGTVIREYRWDQQNRLVRVVEGSHESVYEYDGASRRVRIKELTGGVETKNETFVWCGSRICQKRSSDGSTVARSYFGIGFQDSGTTNFVYTRDHLGSVRDVVGSDGTTVASRLSYDPWGKVTEAGSGALSDFTYTGHYADRATGLNLAQYRAYDAGLGRWISRDPMGILGGLNLYAYVENSPVNARDPSGLTGGFVWGSWGAAIPGPVRPGVEYVALAGLDTDVSGYGYTGNITAAGVEMGGEAEEAAAFYGVERTSDGHETPIQLFEAHLGIEVPFLAGISETAGIFNTNDSFGWYFGPSVAALGEHANVGFGFSISKSWLPDWLTGGPCH